MARKPIPNFRRFDFEAFIEELLSRDLNFAEMFHEFSQECFRVEGTMRGRGGPQARADGGSQYVARLKRVMFWFHHGVLADQGQEASTCRRIAEKMIARGELKPEAIDALS